MSSGCCCSASIQPSTRSRCSLAAPIRRGSRKRRIALGSGLPIQDVNRLLKQHAQMQKMMKKLGGGGARKMLQRLAALKGQMPPGAPGGGRFGPKF